MSSISLGDSSREHALLIPVTSVRLTALIGVSLIIDQLCRLGLTIAAGVSSLDTFGSSMFFSNCVRFRQNDGLCTSVDILHRQYHTER